MAIAGLRIVTSSLAHMGTIAAPSPDTRNLHAEADGVVTPELRDCHVPYVAQLRCGDPYAAPREKTCRPVT
jgi:hypothetical protein